MVDMLSYVVSCDQLMFRYPIFSEAIEFFFGSDVRSARFSVRIFVQSKSWGLFRPVVVSSLDRPPFLLQCDVRSPLPIMEHANNLHVPSNVRQVTHKGGKSFG